MGALPVLSPSVVLLGAGPGDPDLLTVKGYRALCNAQAVLYDALVDERLLALAPEGTPLVYVGKRCGKHSRSQTEINELLIAAARRWGRVVRLKGGDPFVFGRGGEEALALGAAGIPCEVIPGVSSATAVPALAGVPLTHRGVSRGFWVLTATTKQHELPTELEAAARSGATVVILMGTRRIADIAKLFGRFRALDTPMVLLRNGSWSDQERVNGTLDDPPRLEATGARKAGILVIGPTAGMDVLKNAGTLSIAGTCEAKNKSA